jgi:hypothetical protein
MRLLQSAAIAAFIPVRASATAMFRHHAGKDIPRNHDGA